MVRVPPARLFSSLLLVTGLVAGCLNNPPRPPDDRDADTFDGGLSDGRVSDGRGDREPMLDGGTREAGGDAPAARLDGSSLDLGACVPACVLDNKRCGTSGLQTCVANAAGCPAWGPDVSCGAHAACAGGACVCNAPPAGCTAAGTFCSGPGFVSTCTKHTNGCLFVSDTTACTAGQTCQGPANKGACACPPPGNGAGQSCPTAGATTCDGATVLTCTADATCRTWVKTTDCATMGGLTCGTRAGTAACQCPAPTATALYVDPVAGSNSLTGVVSTGAEKPASCRFKTITRALAAVTASGTRIIATTATPPASFTAETFPLTVPAGVTLSTADLPLVPMRYTLVINDAAATAGVVLAGGAAIEGYTVDATAGNPAAPAIACSTGTVGIRSISVTAGGGAGANKHAVGLAIGKGGSDSCAAAISGSTVAGFEIGIAVHTSGAVTIDDSTLRDDGTATAGGGLRISTGAVTSAQLTIGKSANGSVGWGVSMDPDSATVAATLTATGLTITGMSGNGLQSAKDVGMAMPRVTLTNGEIAGHTGLRLLDGIVKLTGTFVHGAAADGLHIDGGEVTVGAGTRIESNAGDGVSIAGGSLTGTGFSSSMNKGSGIAITGGTTAIHKAMLIGNDGRGLVIEGGVALVDDGTTLKTNGAGTSKLSGIRVAGGALILGGTTGDKVEVADSGVDGLAVDSTVAGTVVAVTRTQIHGSGADGLYVALTGANSSVKVTDSDVYQNAAHGVLVDSAPTAGGSGLVLDGVRIYKNGTTGQTGIGAFLRSGLGNVDAAINACAIHENRNTGIAIAQTTFITSETLTGNDIYGNDAAAGGAVGGIHFLTSSTLSAFNGNKVHGNVGDGIGFSAAPNGGTTWPLATSALCGAATNQLYCYPTGAFGIRILDAAPAGTHVDASGTSWSNAVPMQGRDFEHGAGDVVTFAPACPAIPTCN